MAWELVDSNSFSTTYSTAFTLVRNGGSTSFIVLTTSGPEKSITLDFQKYRYRLRVLIYDLQGRVKSTTLTCKGTTSAYKSGNDVTFDKSDDLSGFSIVTDTNGGPNLTFTTIIERISLANGKLKDQAPGTVINFAGSPWTLLEPSTGYLFKNTHVGEMKFDNSNQNVFGTSSIRSYLNNEYYNALSAADRSLILQKIWHAGLPNKESEVKVTARVGLLSHSEWTKYFADTILSKPTEPFWTLTPSTNNSVYRVVASGHLLADYSPGLAGVYVRPVLCINPETNLINGTVVHNATPTITLSSPTNNQTLYENDTFNIAGNAHDTDADQSVTAYYQINNEPRKVLATNLSQTQISLSKQLIFKGSKLFDGEVAITGVLADGVAHTLKVWAVDSEGGQSTTVERTFYVVPNRAPLLAIDAITPSGIIDTDKFTISGTSGDPDANANVKVSYRINAGNAVDIYDGSGGAWEFEVLLAQLKVGENTIIVEVVDNYGAKTSKTIKLNKNTVNTPILQSVARHKISPPKGSARGVLIWVQRDEDLDLTVELSMTLAGEQEQYILLEADPENIVEVSEGIVEDEYYHETVEPKDNIILKLTTSRANVNIDNKIYLIWGVLE
ncbi:DUF6273 domain-containing protein [Lysinibacillus sp. FSL K6-0075]|uniref:DUF6273 domain-containing protein n=1 Tax=Lysinibacillus sp. FSL K6-0075 TaxID=2921415 RepID=UPI0031592613